MSNNDALYIRLFEKLHEFHSEEHLRRIKNWAWIVVGLIQSHSVHLSEIAQHIPSEAEAPGRIAPVRRWLANKFIQVAEFYRPLIKRFPNWSAKLQRAFNCGKTLLFNLRLRPFRLAPVFKKC